MYADMQIFKIKRTMCVEIFEFFFLLPYQTYTSYINWMQY